MAFNPDPSDQYEQLRNQLKRYEASLASAKDRLEAFSRLEAIAKERHQSPEVVAARAAVELLERREATLGASVQALKSQREATQEELSMLLVSKKQATIDLEDIRVNREELAGEVAGILNEIETMRADAARLQAEKSELETEVMELRLVVQEFERKEKKLKPSKNKRRSDDVESEKSKAAAMAAEISGDLGMDDNESAAFDRFFNAGDVDDKARDWMLK